MKYAGTDVSLAVPWAPAAEMAAAFTTLHHRRYGFVMPGRGLTIEALAVEAVGAGADSGEDAGPETALPGHAGDAAPAGAGQPAPGADPEHGAHASASRPSLPAPDERIRLFTAGSWHDAPVHRRDGLPAGALLEGPAVVTEPTSTTVVEPGWHAEVLGGGELLLRRTSPPAPPSADLSQRSPLLLEVFNNLFMSIAEQMGATLQNTACSVNIKERLDFSCAVFDGDGGLVANAPHLPVHLGSMGASVRAVLARHRDELRPGDAYLLNSPYAGGTHLPDLTVVTPVFAGGAGPGGDAHDRRSRPAGRPPLLRRLARPPRRHRRHHARAPCRRTAGASRKRAS